MSWRGILEADARLSGRIRLDGTQHFLRSTAAFLAHSGDSWFWLAALGLIWLLDANEWHHRAALMGFGIGILAVLVLAIKFTIRRRRPEGEWGVIYRSTDPHSFPSGHAARSMMLVVLAFGLGPAWLSLALLLWAPLMSLARVVMGVHYLSDLIGGWILGMMMGLLLIAIHPLLLNYIPFIF